RTTTLRKRRNGTPLPSLRPLCCGRWGFLPADPDAGHGLVGLANCCSGIRENSNARLEVHPPEFSRIPLRKTRADQTDSYDRVPTTQNHRIDAFSDSGYIASPNSWRSGPGDVASSPAMFIREDQEMADAAVKSVKPANAAAPHAPPGNRKSSKLLIFGAIILGLASVQIVVTY